MRGMVPHVARLVSDFKISTQHFQREWSSTGLQMHQRSGCLDYVDMTAPALCFRHDDSSYLFGTRLPGSTL